MSYLKAALFSFICTIIFTITQVITGFLPISILTLVSALACVAFLVVWVSSLIFKRFRHSLNIVLIVIFFVLAVITYLFQGETVEIGSFAELSNVGMMSIAWIASALACCISILVLIGRLIFEKKDTQTDDNEYGENVFQHIE